MLSSAFEFEVGGRYRNRRGAYEVISIEHPAMQIKYDGGDLATVDIATQRRIYANIVGEDERAQAPQPARRPRPKSSRRGTSAQAGAAAGRRARHLTAGHRRADGKGYSIGSGLRGPGC